jgi:hypothetical protein
MRLMRPVAFTLAVAPALALALAGAVVGSRAQEPQSSGAWRSFEGTWSAVGRRQTLPTEGERLAAIIQLSGPVVLANAPGIGGGFRGEAIGFDDGRSVSAGRVVWTDGRGDSVFSVIQGARMQTGTRVFGTITGGTGQFAGASGQYELTWQYVISGEDDVVQGRSVDLRGRIRRNGASP